MASFLMGLLTPSPLLLFLDVQGRCGSSNSIIELDHRTQWCAFARTTWAAGDPVVLSSTNRNGFAFAPATTAGSGLGRPIHHHNDERSLAMSDKPKPGKDKDQRFIRQAMEATQALFGLLGEQLAEPDVPHNARLLAEALLLTTDQLDLLDQMLADVTCAPTTVIEQNRQLRQLVRSLLRENESANRPVLARVAHATGTQLSALLVVKEIRQPQ